MIRIVVFWYLFFTLSSVIIALRGSIMVCIARGVFFFPTPEGNYREDTLLFMVDIDIELQQWSG